MKNTKNDFWRWNGEKSPFGGEKSRKMHFRWFQEEKLFSSEIFSLQNFSQIFFLPEIFWGEKIFFPWEVWKMTFPHFFVKKSFFTTFSSKSHFSYFWGKNIFFFQNFFYLEFIWEKKYFCSRSGEKCILELKVVKNDFYVKKWPKRIFHTSQGKIFFLSKNFKE